ncbi:putative polysaccharide biosynthesis protein [Metabacillus fastidiosus]|uniref:Polysaccharide biosynthesis protein n=1 Tax=Metabacillus fastidiosus TaxID=1458 RepID=A0ABU6P4E9_9BACI|nr:polysaccharide biosynthesis protein [Metabacillus fastidiosus]MED4404161.1 polysaccharide biosynthesis protein [Metabacillus fastidiosus]MED4455570.1 polysaccharide biosynthesis protein [Metabacillus fastidiosus]MED4464712.1 polysaccharide biosynthesis protein [Metabacillus fastidiosus]
MEIPKRTNGEIIKGALILTMAALFIKILSAVYRVPYQNIVGDIGFYIYQQIYPLYGIAVMLSTAGFPVIISKVMSDYNEHGKAIKEKVLTITLLFLLGVGIFLFLALYINAEAIAYLMGDLELKKLIQVTAFSFLLIPFTSFFRGYFQGVEQMEPTAFSQVTEQAVRVGAILLVSYFLIHNGYTLYEAGEGAFFGSVVGIIAALIILIKFWVKENRKISFRWNLSGQLKAKGVIWKLIKYSLTIGFSSLLLLFIQLIDSFNLYSLLILNGLDENSAKMTKGIYDRGQPLIQLGTVVATSIALSIVPSISNAKKMGNENLISKEIKYTLKICFVVGVGATFGLMFIIKQVNTMLFRNQLGSDVLMILTISILFTSLSLTVIAILQGLGHTVFPALSIFIALLVKYIVNIMLIQKFGTSGAAISTVIAYLIVALLNLIYLRKLKYQLINISVFLKIILSAFFMIAALFLFQNVIEPFIFERFRPKATFLSLTSVLIGGLVYVFSIIKLQVFTENELKLIPFGNKVMKLLKLQK